MSVDHTDFTRFAANLKSSSQEIDRRNAVSRSYYGAFHHLKYVVDFCDIKDHRGQHGNGEHTLLISKFTQFRDQPHLPLAMQRLAKRIGYLMEEAKKWRNKADYHLELDFPGKEAEMHYIGVDRVHELCAELVNLFNQHLSTSS